MSLINDALKQAKATQLATTPVVGEHALRPVEPARRSSGPGFLLPVIILVVLVVASVLLWQWFHGSGELKVRANTVAPTSATTPASLVATPMPVVATAPATPVSTAPVQSPAAPEPVQAVATPMSEPTVTNVVAVEPAKPQTPTYKLQSIFYRPKNPSAVINGKLAYVGQRVSDARVIAITAESATIVTSAGQTNVLELP
ncbi:MAG: hypothetical protein JWQ71_3547 [Pedosphaera sp.]|nr:hypothetical protein [Pedosphaera sp.]